jgi:hypothetical protein
MYSMRARNHSWLEDYPVAAVSRVLRPRSPGFQRAISTHAVTLKGRPADVVRTINSPGPGAYKVPEGIEGSTGRGVSIQSRRVDSHICVESMQRLGPGTYDTRGECGDMKPAFSLGRREFTTS